MKICCQGYEIKENELSTTYSTHGEMRNAHKISVGIPKGKRPHTILGVDVRMILK
jgi:hypothetical protein